MACRGVLSLDRTYARACDNYGNAKQVLGASLNVIRSYYRPRIAAHPRVTACQQRLVNAPPRGGTNIADARAAPRTHGRAQ